MCVRHAVRHIGADQIAAHNAARKNHGQTRMLGQGVVCHPHKRFAHAEQTVFADIGRVMPVGQQLCALVLKAGQTARQPVYTDLGMDFFFTQSGLLADIDARRERKAQLDAEAVHSLSGVEVGAGPQRLDMLHFIAKEQVSRAAGNVEQQCFLAEELFTFGRKQCRRRMALLEESARLLYREWFVRLRFPGHEHTPIVDGVPQGWERKTLESVCLSGNGIQTGPFGSQLHQADYSEEGVPVVMPKDIIDFRVSVASIARIPEGLADALGRHRMIPGDTVYGRRGDIGRRAFIGKRQQGWFCGTGSLRIRPDPQAVNPLYLFDYLGTPAAVGDITNRAKGSTMLNLSAAALKPVPVLVPSRTLQEMYAVQIEQVREMVETLDEQNQKLRTARDLLLPRLMSGELSV